MENKLETKRIILSTMVLLATIILFAVLYNFFMGKDEFADLELTAEEQEYYNLIHEMGVPVDTTVADLREATQQYFDQFDLKLEVDSKSFDEYLIYCSSNLESLDFNLKEKLNEDPEFAKVYLYTSVYYNDQGLGDPLGKSDYILAKKDSDTVDIIMKRQIIYDREQSSDLNSGIVPTSITTSE